MEEERKLKHNRNDTMTTVSEQEDSELLEFCRDLTKRVQREEMDADANAIMAGMSLNKEPTFLTRVGDIRSERMRYEVQNVF